MRIGIDGRMLGNTGIGRYLRNLLIHLAQEDTRNEYIVFINDEDTQGIEQKNFVFVTLRPPVPIYSLAEQYRLPFEIRRWKPDLMHYPNFDIPLIQSCPYLVTIHDLIYYVYPEQCPSKIAYYYAAFMLKYAVKHAQAIITDSQHSKLDLIHYLQLPEEKLNVIFPAAETSSSPLRNPEQAASLLKQHYGITQPYIFYVGKHHSYKNISTLLRAFNQSSEIYRNVQLVIAGKKDERRQDLYAEAAALNCSQQIIFTDFIPEEHLFELYRGAELFVFPSLYEGFGLPPLEALACGVPVISSSAASLPEVLGDAAIYFDPLNVDELAEAIRRVLGTKELRNRLQKEGEQQVQKFSWKTAALKHLELYERFSHR